MIVNSLNGAMEENSNFVNTILEVNYKKHSKYLQRKFLNVCHLSTEYIQRYANRKLIWNNTLYNFLQNCPLLLTQIIDLMNFKRILFQLTKWME